MSSTAISRRGILVSGTAAVGAILASGASAAPAAEKPAGFKFCLNGCTIWGQKRLPLVQQLQTAAKAGFDAFEPWLQDIEAAVKGGQSLADLRKRISDLGLSIENAIGFAAWIVDDPAARARGLDQFKRDMDTIAQLGGKRIAAPPVGATNIASFDLAKAAERYRDLCEIGQQFSVAPQIEIWGSSKTLSKLGEALCVAAESGHPLACVLPDVFHMYKSGTSFGGFRIASRFAVQELHLNDYPDNPPRDKIRDEHRVFPGDGIAPLPTILKDLRANNPRCVLSLELFNREYWKQDPLAVAQTGLAKMKAVAERAA